MFYSLEIDKNKSLNSVLQNTLTELKDQQRKFEEWNGLQEKIASTQTSVGQRLRSQLEYQELRHRTTRTPPRNSFPSPTIIFINSLYSLMTCSSSHSVRSRYF